MMMTSYDDGHWLNDSGEPNRTKTGIAHRVSILEHRDRHGWLDELCPFSSLLATIDVDCLNGLS